MCVMYIDFQGLMIVCIYRFLRVNVCVNVYIQILEVNHKYQALLYYHNYLLMFRLYCITITINILISI